VSALGIDEREAGDGDSQRLAAPRLLCTFTPDFCVGSVPQLHVAQQYLWWIEAFDLPLCVVEESCLISRRGLLGDMIWRRKLKACLGTNFVHYLYDQQGHF